MLELLWLLLPVAAASGWLAARRASASGSKGIATSFNTDYFKGLNYLLNEQPDKAIEVFVRMVEVDSDTVETHLALGNLFRRRGEVDRAIRIHQNLIARPSLSHEYRAQALYELGEDYMKAGLFDRAESLFQELVVHELYRKGALRHLLDIYQQEQDWEKAIETSRRLENAGRKKLDRVIAQYYCEMAENALLAGNEMQATQMIRQAHNQDRNCVRASLLQGKLLLLNQDYKEAIKAFKRVAEQDVEYFPEVIEALTECYDHLRDRDGLMSYFREILSRYDGISLVLTLAEFIQQREGDQAAMEFLAEHLKKRPSVRGLKWLVELNLDKCEGRARENLQLLNDLSSNLLQGKPVYECNICSFSGKSMHWQCPGCKAWNSVKPVKGIDGE